MTVRPSSLFCIYLYLLVAYAFAFTPRRCGSVNTVLSTRDIEVESKVFRLYAVPPRKGPPKPAVSAAGGAAAGPRARKPPKDDVVQVTGRVTESLPNAMFRVEIEPSKQVVLATICGKIRKNNVRIVVGDSVVCDLSAYDLTKGRITYRNK